MPPAANELATIREQMENSKVDRRDLWTAIAANREAATNYRVASERILEKLEAFEQRAYERHARIDAENTTRDSALRMLGDANIRISERVSVLETEKKLISNLAKVLWGGLGAGAIWIAHTLFGLPSPK